MTMKMQIEALEGLAALDAELRDLTLRFNQEQKALTDKKTQAKSLEERLSRSRSSIADMDEMRGDLLGELRQMGIQVERSREKLLALPHRARGERRAARGRGASQALSRPRARAREARRADSAGARRARRREPAARHRFRRARRDRARIDDEPRELGSDARREAARTRSAGRQGEARSLPALRDDSQAQGHGARVHDATARAAPATFAFSRCCSRSSCAPRSSGSARAAIGSCTSARRRAGDRQPVWRSVTAASAAHGSRAR